MVGHNNLKLSSAQFVRLSIVTHLHLLLPTIDSAAVAAAAAAAAAVMFRDVLEMRDEVNQYSVY